MHCLMWTLFITKHVSFVIRLIMFLAKWKHSLALLIKVWTPHLLVQGRIQEFLKGEGGGLYTFKLSTPSARIANAAGESFQGAPRSSHFFFRFCLLKRDFQCSWHLKSVMKAWYKIWSLPYFSTRKTQLIIQSWNVPYLQFLKPGSH